MGWLLLGCDPSGSSKHLYAYPRVKGTHVCDCHTNITSDSHFWDKNVKTECNFQLGYLWILSHASFTEWFFGPLRKIMYLRFSKCGLVKMFCPNSVKLSICTLFSNKSEDIVKTKTFIRKMRYIIVLYDLQNIRWNLHIIGSTDNRAENRLLFLHFCPRNGYQW